MVVPSSRGIDQTLACALAIGVGFLNDLAGCFLFFFSLLKLTFAGLFRGQSLVEAVTNANATRQSLKFGYSPPGCCPTWLFRCLLLNHHVVGKPLQPGSKDGLGEGGRHAMEPSESLLTL